MDAAGAGAAGSSEEDDDECHDDDDLDDDNGDACPADTFCPADVAWPLPCPGNSSTAGHVRRSNGARS